MSMDREDESTPGCPAVDATGALGCDPPVTCGPWTTLPGQSSQNTALTQAVRVVAAGSPQAWDDELAHSAARLDLPQTPVQLALVDAGEAWDLDPRKPTQRALGTQQVRECLEAAEAQSPAERWAALGASLEHKLPHEPDWVLPR